MSAKAETVIAEFPPADGRDWEPQCARCGSSAVHERCEMCGGEGLDGHDCGEDCCFCLSPEDNVPCDTCCGRGGWYRCCSSPDFCQKNPNAGREAIERGQIEWYTFDPPPTKPAPKEVQA